ncbi:MAG: hypothetical protein FWH37_09195 [Candidatus Bathyarchaeota archaeon]|nr:hypothetical protein [Candidatus Termiticorpusculum sp.]
MSKNSKSTNSLQCFHNRKALLFASLLFIITLTFFCLVSEFNSVVSPFALGTSDKTVSNEIELRDAVNNAPTKNSYTITFNNDITLTDSSLVISANKDITLTSNKIVGHRQLIGASGTSTLIVEDAGVLKLDGIIVTHTSGQGRGVTINLGGKLVLLSGEISGNTAPATVGAVGGPQGFSGGVGNMGVFEMYGGKISNNSASNGAGGGVGNSGIFDMYGGEISNNNALSITSTNAWGAGGGVYNSGTFSMSGGEICNNYVDYEGGGVYNYGVFTMSGGKISGNTASEGGGVYVSWSGTFDRQGGVISGNTLTNKDGEGKDVCIRSNGGSSNGVGGGSGGDGGGSINGGSINGGGSGFEGDGGLSNGNGGVSEGDGYSLKNAIIVCVGVVGLVVGVVAVGLFFYFGKRMEQMEAKFNTLSQDKVEE